MYNLLVVHVSDIISSSCKWREPSEFHPYGDQDGDATWNWKLNLRKCKGKKSFQLWFAETYAHLVNTFCKWSSVFRHYLGFFSIPNKNYVYSCDCFIRSTCSVGADVRATKKVQQDKCFFSLLYCCSVTLFELLFPLWCGTDSGVIHMQAALYGRADRETCSEGRPAQQLNNIQCSQKGVLEVFKKTYSNISKAICNHFNQLLFFVLFGQNK